MHNDTFPSHSNKRSTGTSRVLPLWFSRTPEGGRCASVFEFTQLIEKSVAAIVWKKMKVSACFHQARKLLRELKYQKRCEEAVTTIAAFWHGTQVLISKSEVFTVPWCSWTLVSIASNPLVFLLYAVFLPKGTTVLQDGCSLTNLSFNVIAAVFL